MKFTANIARQLRAIVRFVKGCETYKNHDDFHFIRIRADADLQRVTIYGNTFDRYVSYSCPAKVETEGDCRYSVDHLLNLIKKTNCRSSFPEMSFKLDSVSLKNHHQHAIPLNFNFDAVNFPDTDHIPEEAWFSADVSALRQAVSKTLYAASRDTVKRVITGIHFDGNATATDGHRLVTVSTPFTPNAPFTLPASYLYESDDKQDLFTLLDGLGVRLFDSLSIVHDNTQAGKYLHLRHVNEPTDPADEEIVEITLRTINHYRHYEYPRYQQLIPLHFKYSLTIDRQTLLEAVEKLRPHSEFGTVTLSGFSGSVDNGDEGYLTCRALPIAGVKLYDKSTGKTEQSWFEDGGLSFDLKYMRDALTACSGDYVTVLANSETTPFVVRGTDSETHLIMPIRLSEPRRSEHFSLIKYFKAHFPAA